MFSKTTFLVTRLLSVSQYFKQRVVSILSKMVIKISKIKRHPVVHTADVMIKVPGGFEC